MVIVKRYRIIPVVGLLSAMLVLSALGTALAEEDSYLIGRLFGSTQPLPGYFRGNVNLMSNNVYPEFPGFRFVNSQSGKKTHMRPDSRGYFFKSMEPGTWTFERLRKDRPAGSLVNLGTIIIVVDGKPTERLRIKSHSEEGTYVYTYRYARSDSADDNTWPLDNLKRKKPKILENYKDSTVEVKDPVTTDLDSSRIKLRAFKGN
jgi:hypothetical protein